MVYVIEPSGATGFGQEFSDVYKRQCLHSPVIMCWQTIPTPMAYVISVSETHLDVYKRQQCHRILFNFLIILQVIVHLHHILIYRMNTKSLREYQISTEIRQMCIRDRPYRG